MDLKEIIKEDVYNLFCAWIEKENIQVEVPKDKSKGDYALPCFSYTKALQLSPNEIAKYLVGHLENYFYENLEVVNGYLNIFIKREILLKYVVDTIKEKKHQYGSNDLGNSQVVVIDYSSPNIAKPFGVGHLRSTVIGNALKNIYFKNGYNVISINHLGDWGTQFGKLIYAYKQWGDEELVFQDPISELTKLYVKFHEEVKKDPNLEDKGREYFKKLEDGDDECLKLWEWFRNESIKEFNKTYELLGIDQFDSYDGEAFYNDKMDIIINELQNKNLLEEDCGAYIIRLDEECIPALIKRSDGASLYMTRELAASFYRKQKYNFSKCLYVVGNEQILHFKQLKLIIKKMGYEWGEDIEHISFGMLLQDGKKMSTRSGTGVKLHDVLLSSISLATKYIKDVPKEEIDDVAKKIGVGAVIFNDLKNYRINDIDFNLEDILKFEGETGPYIQYTYARINSLLKYKQNLSLNYEQISINNLVWNILFKLYMFPEIIVRAKEKNDPSEIAKYVIELATHFNKFYAEERIIIDDLMEREFKLVVCEMISLVLEEGMRILGIELPKNM